MCVSLAWRLDLGIIISIRHVAFLVISAFRQLSEKECLQFAHGLVIPAIESECELIDGADGDFNRHTGFAGKGAFKCLHPFTENGIFDCVA